MYSVILSDELTGFEDAWRGNVERHFPGWSDGSNFFGDAGNLCLHYALLLLFCCYYYRYCGAVMMNSCISLLTTGQMEFVVLNFSRNLKTISGRI